MLLLFVVVVVVVVVVLTFTHRKRIESVTTGGQTPISLESKNIVITLANNKPIDLLKRGLIKRPDRVVYIPGMVYLWLVR